MTEPVPRAEARLATARAAVLGAGALARSYFGRASALAVEAKTSPQDVASAADREVERLVRQRIGDAFPEDAVLGEEYGLTAGTSGLTRVLDPIDGTSAFSTAAASGASRSPSSTPAASPPG